MRKTDDFSIMGRQMDLYPDPHARRRRQLVAIRWLRKRLAGDVEVRREDIETWGIDSGFTREQIHRAKDFLGVKSLKSKKAGEWWSLAYPFDERLEKRRYPRSTRKVVGEVDQMP